MLNKPKFSIFKNISYSLNGAKWVLRSEKSFKIQLFVIFLIGVGLFFVPFSLRGKLILFFSTWIILIAEAFNSAIERVVDLVTSSYHPLAKEAKDIGSFGVLLSFILIFFIWIIVIGVEVGYL
ncbi:MAG: diacylglycerol kinase [Epsilonproteobacteria bacterium]|nr:diacylglycerol kinase [Campylobacterota bacterium]